MLGHHVGRRLRSSCCLLAAVLLACDSGEIGSPTNAGAAGGGGPGTAVEDAGTSGRVLPFEPVATCGNGQLDGGELCDGPASCPTACDDQDACTVDTLAGAASTCDAQCVYTPISACASGDGCCPLGCHQQTDDDCAPVCGNGVTEADELCDGADCPVSCDDADPCTEDVPVGDAAACTAACEHMPIAGCDRDHARGITVSQVTFDQGVRVDLVAEGTEIEQEERNARLVASRPGLLRAFWTLDSDFEGRAIRAELSLQHSDGREQVLEATAEVDAATPSYGRLSQSFAFELTAEQVEPGVLYAIELFETDSAYTSLPLPEQAPRLPEVEGEHLALGVQSTYMKMRVVLVPLDHDLASECPEPPDLSASFGDTTEEAYIRERIYAMNPVDEVETIVHDVVPYTGTTRDAAPIFTLLRQLREQDDAPPEHYYFALINPCDGGPPFAGVAVLGIPSRRAAFSRTGWGVFRSRGRAADVVVHELGHQQGREHVACSGREDAVDPEYPNRDGSTGSWGWDVHEREQIYDPERADYMSYCAPIWVSEYGWNFVWDNLETVSSWELEQAFVERSATVEPTGPRALHIMVNADGSVSPWLSRHDLPEWAAHGTERVVFFAGDRRLAELPAVHEAIPESSAYQLSVGLQEDLGRVTHIVFGEGDGLRTIPAQAIKRLH